jgi:excisionase family DNA binding protein
VFFFAENFFMENPFEIIIEKLNSIEALLKSMSRVDNGNVAVTEILNVDEAANYLSVTKSHIYKQTSQNEIPHYKRGKKIYFKRSELDEWLTKHRITTKEEIDRMATEYILRNPLKGRRY